MLRNMLSEMRSGDAAAAPSSERASEAEEEEPIVRAPDVQQVDMSLFEENAEEL